MGACARLGRAVAPLAGQWRRRRVTISPLEQCAYRQITGDANDSLARRCLRESPELHSAVKAAGDEAGRLRGEL